MSRSRPTWRSAGAILLLQISGLALMTAHCADNNDDPDGIATSTASTTASTTSGFEDEPSVELCPSSECVFPFVDCNGDLTDGCESDVANDRANCGACGNRCALTASCIQGRCELVCGINALLGACSIPYQSGDCDGSPITICEVNLDADPKHCGTCGNVCAPGVPCIDGICGCPAGRVMCGTICADLESDARNCNGCGNVCPDDDLDDDLFPRCVEGVCEIACREECGYFDCDDDTTTACVPLGTSENCGACGDACGPGVVCVSGKCCDQLDLETDTENCGACFLDCRVTFENRFAAHDPGFPRTSFAVSCVDGTCGATCVLPYQDCDGDIAAETSNGCETDTSHDPKNCGACGAVCAEDQVCLFGQCATQPCEPGAPQ